MQVDGQTEVEFGRQGWVDRQAGSRGRKQANQTEADQGEGRGHDRCVEVVGLGWGPQNSFMTMEPLTLNESLMQF